MIHILKLVLAIIGFSLLTEVSFGQGDAPAILRGLNQSDKSIGSFIRTPNGQTTKISSSSALIETGNNNILENPNFEHSVFDTSWVIGSGSSSKVDVNIDNTKVFSGLNALKMTMTAEPLNVFNVSPTGNQAYKDGVQGLVSVRVKTTVSGVKVCQRKGYAVTTNCVNVNSDGKWGLYKIPSILGEFYNGVEITSSPTSVTGDVYIDDAFAGVMDGAQLVNNIGPWITFTPTGTWTANTTYTGKYRQVGENLEIQYDWATSGAPTSADLNLNMPSGFTIDSTKFPALSTQSTIDATGNAEDSGTAYYDLKAYYVSTTSIGVTVKGAAGTYVTANAQPSQTIPFTWGAGDHGELYVKVPITQFSGSTSVYTASCGANCVDTFTARISGNTVSTTNTPSWVTCSASGNDSSCTFAAGIFTVTPSCQVSTLLNSANTLAPKIKSISTSVITLTASTNANATFNVGEYFLSCSKQGADFVATRTIVGSFAEVPTTKGSNGADIQSVYFGAGADCSTACTTGTCIICNQAGNRITSVTWQSTGNYRLNGIDGTKYNCTGGGISAPGAYLYQGHSRPGSSSTYATVQNAGTDIRLVSINCIGIP